MAIARIGKEILIETPDEVGMLAKVSGAIAKAGINVISICAYGMEGKAYFMLLTSDNAKVKQAMEPFNFKVTEDEVVMVDLEDKIGAIEEMSRELANAGINLEYIYGTTSLGEGACFLILNSDNNDKVIELLNK